MEIPKIAGEYTEKEIAQAVKLMEKAKRPCIYCGGGVIMADAGEEIMELSRRLDAPICHSLMGVDAVPTSLQASECLGCTDNMHQQRRLPRRIC